MNPVTTVQDDAKEKKRQKQLAEFLAIMGPRGKARAWENEEPDRPQAVHDHQKEKQRLDQAVMLEADAKQPEDMSDLEWMRSCMKRKGTDLGERGFDGGRVFEQSGSECGEEEANTVEKIRHPILQVRKYLDLLFIIARLT